MKHLFFDSLSSKNNILWCPGPQQSHFSLLSGNRKDFKVWGWHGFIYNLFNMIWYELLRHAMEFNDRVISWCSNKVTTTLEAFAAPLVSFFSLFWMAKANFWSADCGSWVFGNPNIWQLATRMPKGFQNKTPRVAKKDLQWSWCLHSQPHPLRYAEPGLYHSMSCLWEKTGCSKMT